MILEMIPDEYYSQLYDELKKWHKRRQKKARMEQIKQDVQTQVEPDLEIEKQD